MTRLALLFSILLSLSSFAAQEQASHAQAPANPRQEETTYAQAIRRAFDCLATDSLSAARQHFNEALRISPDATSNATVYHYLGKIYEREGELQKALDSYTRGIRIVPRDTALVMSRASAYLLAGNGSGAIEDYSTILDIDSKRADVLLFRAYAYVKERKAAAARKDYEAILRLNPMHENARLGLVLLNDNNHRPREAMEGINLLIEHYPTHGNLFLVRAGMEHKRRQYEVALHDYSEAVRLLPKDPEPLLARAQFLLDTGDKKAALADLKAALSLGADANEVATLANRAAGH